MAEMETINVSSGAGVVGRLSSRLEVGGYLPSINDSNRYQQPLSTVTSLIR